MKTFATLGITVCIWLFRHRSQSGYFVICSNLNFCLDSSGYFVIRLFRHLTIQMGEINTCFLCSVTSGNNIIIFIAFQKRVLMTATGVKNILFDHISTPLCALNYCGIYGFSFHQYRIHSFTNSIITTQWTIKRES